jgi:hypothetical protein
MAHRLAIGRLQHISVILHRLAMRFFQHIPVMVHRLAMIMGCIRVMLQVMVVLACLLATLGDSL